MFAVARTSFSAVRMFSSGPAVLKGKVKWFNVTKGFGFIVPENGGAEVFVHQSSIHATGFRSLDEGEDVEYVVEADQSGRQKTSRVTGPNGGFVKGAPRQFQQQRAGGDRPRREPSL